MKRKVFLVILIIIILGAILGACYQTRHFLEIQPKVVNMEELNTEYDDFNAAGLPSYRSQQDFLFSTNAPSKGEYFDIQYARKDLTMGWDDDDDKKVTDKHTFNLRIMEGPTPFLEEEVNSDSDEYGPFITHLEGEYFRFKDNYDKLENDIIYFVASDREDGKNFSIYYYTKEGGLNEFKGNKEEANDYYLTYHRESNTIYFCSNRNGSYDIYSYQSEDVSGLEDLLEKETEAEPVEVLNSDYDDKTPYISEDIMVFVSDRNSNGNFNIYFSKFKNGNWSEPKKLPQRIEEDNDDSFNYLNTEHNEYRPIIFENRKDKKSSETVTNNEVMIFSSDRPGGVANEGNYDLYLAVLPLDIFD